MYCRGLQSFPQSVCHIIVVLALSLSFSVYGAASGAIETAGTAAAAGELDAAAAAAGAAASMSPEYMWFEKHVAYKCFSPPDATWKLDEAAKETVLHRQTQFFGVYDQPDGFYYHYSTTTKQTEYNLVDGVRVEASKPQRHSDVYRCQYGVRRSTKAVFGICYPSDATGVPVVQTAVPWPFTVYASTLKLLDANTLQQTLSTLPAYEDLLAATPTGVKPGRQETVITYTLAADGKVALSTKVSVFDVDPVSLEGRFVGTQEPGVERQVPCKTR